VPAVLAHLIRCRNNVEDDKTVDTSFERCAIPYLARRDDKDGIATLLAACAAIGHCEYGGQPEAAEVPPLLIAPLKFDLYCCDPDLAPAARLLDAWSTGALYDRCPEDLSDAGTVPTALLAEPGHQATALSWRILDHTRQVIDAGEPADLPSLSLLTARDMPSILWLVAKTICYALENAHHVGRSSSYRLLEPRPDGSEWTDLNRSNGGTPEVSISTGAQSAAVINSPCGVLLANTHGLDAVLGRLACGRDLPCPRGPFPVSLRSLAAEMMVLSSCNGFRPGEGNLTADFNLGLSFLDGAGAWYCSSIYSATGGRLAVAAIGAALASGESFGAAIAYANSFLRRSGVEDVNMVAIGDPCAQRPLTPNPGPPVTISGTAIQSEIDCSDAWRCDIVIDCPDLVEKARAGTLAWQVLDGGTPASVMWDMWIAMRNDGEHLHLRLSRFPQRLGRVMLMPYDRSEIRKTVTNGERSMARWEAVLRLLDSQLTDDALFQEVRAVQQSINNRFAAIDGRSRYDGQVGVEILHLAKTVPELLTHVRDLVLESFLPRLCAPVWLTNVLSTEYSARTFGST